MEGSIAITFEHEGKQYSGRLDPVCGAGGDTWHLMMNERYYGRLRLNDQGWFFDGPFKELAEFFGKYVMKGNVESRLRDATDGPV